MPKLHGYRERLPFNTYDAFSPREFQERATEVGFEHWFSTHLPIWGHKNIGNIQFSNLQVAGSLVASDQTAYIQNWYARSNFVDVMSSDVLKAWNAFTHVTTVSMVMGCTPVAQLQLADLLHRKQGDLAALGERCERHMGEVSGPCHHAREDLAARMLAATIGGVANAQRAWQDADNRLRQLYMGAAEAAEDLFGRPPPIVLPVRQCFSVKLNTDHRALGALLETMPSNVVPQALCWIHVEGVAARDVA